MRERPVIHAPDGTVLAPLPRIPTYIGVCCREWPLAVMMRGRCGDCGEVPVYDRPDTFYNDPEPTPDPHVRSMIADLAAERDVPRDRDAITIAGVA